MFTNKEAVLNYFDVNRSKLPFETRIADATKLPGGYTNFVFRLRFEDNSTAVLKYYVSWTIQLNNVASKKRVSQNYLSEKRALQLLSDTSKHFGMIRAPKLYSFDDDLFYLIMEDCGDERAVTLTDMLSNKYQLPDSLNTGDEKKNNKIVENFLKRLAADLRKFTHNIANLSPETHGTDFRSSQFWIDRSQAYYLLIREVANDLDMQKELEPFYDLTFEQPTTDAHFVHGDLWPNGIIIDMERNRAWIIDWEMARFDEEFTDFNELCYYLWLMDKRNDLLNNQRVNLLLRALQFNYLGDESADWKLNNPTNVLKNVLRLLLTSYNTREYLVDPFKIVSYKRYFRKFLNEYYSLKKNLISLI